MIPDIITPDTFRFGIHCEPLYFCPHLLLKAVCINEFSFLLFFFQLFYLHTKCCSLSQFPLPEFFTSSPFTLPMRRCSPHPQVTHPPPNHPPTPRLIPLPASPFAGTQVFTELGESSPTEAKKAVFST